MTQKKYIILITTLVLILVSTLTYEYLTIRAELQQEQTRYSELIDAYSRLEDRVYYYGVGCNPAGACSTSLVMKNIIGSYKCWGTVNDAETAICIEPILPIQYETEDVESCNSRTFSNGLKVTSCFLKSPTRGGT